MQKNLVEVDPLVRRMNRYSDIIPYKHTLVEIKGTELNYINANWIDGAIMDS